MPQLKLRADYQKVLGELGVTGLRIPPVTRLHPKTAFEAPLHASGTMNLGTMIRVGAFTLINGGRYSEVEIGRYCSIAADVAFGAAEHPTDRVTSSTITYSPGFYDWDLFYNRERSREFRARGLRFGDSRPTTYVGHDVWIGYGAFIKAGVTIGTGSIIGAGSVVVQDIPPYSIAVGVPARVKRLRFSENQVERLLALQWWKYGIFEFLGETLGDVDRFCDEVERRAGPGGDVTPFEPPWLDVNRLLSELYETAED